MRTFSIFSSVKKGFFVFLMNNIVTHDVSNILRQVVMLVYFRSLLQKLRRPRCKGSIYQSSGFFAFYRVYPEWLIERFCQCALFCTGKAHSLQNSVPFYRIECIFRNHSRQLTQNKTCNASRGRELIYLKGPCSPRDSYVEEGNQVLITLTSLPVNQIKWK